MTDITKYTDTYGLLGRLQRDGSIDGGDSLHKTSHYGIYRSPALALVFNCEIAKGVFVRNPDPNKWYSNPNTTSRDQLKALLCYLVIEGFTGTLKRVFKDHLKRLLLFTANTRNNGSYPTLEEYNKHSPQKPWDGYKWKIPDITLFEVWALYIRGFRCRIMYPFLYIFDLESLFGAILSKYNGNTDLANSLGVYLLSKQVMDTFVMKLARRIAKPYLYERLETYFTQEGEPPLHEYAKPLIESL